MRENSYLRNKSMYQAKLNEEKKLGAGTNQEQLGHKKFQDIADERYQSKLSTLRGQKVDVEAISESAKQSKEKMDTLKDLSFNKKWEKR